MEVDSDNELLIQLAGGASIDGPYWPDLRTEILARLDKIAHEQFPIPNLPAPPRPLPSPPVNDDQQARLVSPLPSSQGAPSSQNAADADKENAPAVAPPVPTAPVAQAPEPQQLEPGQLPQQLAELLEGIVAQVDRFEKQPPHTIQRLAELVLRPGRHYKALGSYLHAVDRVVRVTSAVSNYPLPPAIPDMSSLARSGSGIGGGSGGDEGGDDPATAVAWSNPANSTLGTDEALGGALLTPIPWLTTQRSPEKPTAETPGAQIHSESTETIDGPNGMGSIETVTVSVNGIRSAGHARAITQGELLRQEQRAGVVPVIQLSRSQEAAAGGRAGAEDVDEGGETGGHEVGGATRDGDVDITDDGSATVDDDEDGVPHARGPDEIGVGDTGLQREGTTYIGGAGLDAHDIDVEAAVGRKHEDDVDTDADVGGKPTPPHSPSDEAMAGGKDSSETLDRSSPGAESTSSVSTKRGAGEDPEGEPAKKHVKEGDAPEGVVPQPSMAGSDAADDAAKAAQGAEERGADDTADVDTMDTGK